MKNQNNLSEKILIIKLGALGDIIYATTAFRAIRNYYPKAHIILLTTSNYVNFCQQLGWFDEIFCDSRKISSFWQVRKILHHHNFNQIYDLQMVDRTKIYQKLSPEKNVWVLPQENLPHHPLKRFGYQFNKLNIPYTPTLDLKFMAESFTHPQLTDNFVVLVAGASLAHQGRKRWSMEKFAALAQKLQQNNLIPVIVGQQAEEFTTIKKICPEVVDLCGQTSLMQLIYLGTKAKLAIGNDTGPMILLHSGGCPTITLYSKVTTTHRGGVPDNYLQAENINDINVEDVWTLTEKKLNLL